MKKLLRNIQLVFVFVIGLIAVSIATGWTVVRPGELAVVRRFGAPLSKPWGPGLHVATPFGIDRVDLVRTGAPRSMTIGAVGIAGPDENPETGEYLTGDHNLIRARGVVRYRVADAIAFGLAGDRVESSLVRLADASLARSLARRGIDASLRDDRSLIAREIESELAEAVERYRLGVRVLGVDLTDARPPNEVQADFDAAQSARSRRDERIEQARSDASRIQTAAQAEAIARDDRARASADRTARMAHSGAERFRKLVVELRRARPPTIVRIYHDAMAELLPKVERKLVVAPEDAVDLGLTGAEPGRAK